MERVVPQIPRFLNQADKIAFFTWNELLLFFTTALVIGTLCGAFISVLFGSLAVYLMRKLQNSPYGDLTKVGLYWFSPFSRYWFKKFPPSHIREFLG